MIDDVRLSLEGRKPVYFHGRTGGIMPTPTEVLETIWRAADETESDYWLPDGADEALASWTEPDSARGLYPTELYE